MQKVTCFSRPDFGDVVLARDHESVSVRAHTYPIRCSLRIPSRRDGLARFRIPNGRLTVPARSGEPLSICREAETDDAASVRVRRGIRRDRIHEVPTRLPALDGSVVGPVDRVRTLWLEGRAPDQTRLPLERSSQREGGGVPDFSELSNRRSYQCSVWTEIRARH